MLGSDTIPAELLKYGGIELQNCKQKLIKDIWEK